MDTDPFLLIGVISLIITVIIAVAGGIWRRVQENRAEEEAEQAALHAALLGALDNNAPLITIQAETPGARKRRRRDT